MKTRLFRRGCSALAGLTLMTTMLAAGAVAQVPDGPGGGGPPPGGPDGGPPPGGPGGPGQGADARAAFRGPSPFAVGTVNAVEAGAGTITIVSQFGGGSNSQVIRVSPDAQIVTQSEVAVADLKVGDQVQVQGVPTGIAVSSVIAGKAPVGLSGSGGFGPGGPGGTATPPSFATAKGTIKALPTRADPHLTVSLSADIQLSLKIADGTKITRYTVLKISDIKSGDRVMASGETAADGARTAGMVAINLPAQNGFGRPNGPRR